jgi:1,4-alpha-glucan branching enzyme
MLQTADRPSTQQGKPLPTTNVKVYDTQSQVSCSQKYGFGIRDPEKNLFRIPDPEVKKAPDPGSGSATLIGMIC